MCQNHERKTTIRIGNYKAHLPHSLWPLPPTLFKIFLQLKNKQIKTFIFNVKWAKLYLPPTI